MLRTSSSAISWFERPRATRRRGVGRDVLRAERAQRLVGGARLALGRLVVAERAQRAGELAARLRGLPAAAGARVEVDRVLEGRARVAPRAGGGREQALGERRRGRARAG